MCGRTCMCMLMHTHTLTPCVSLDTVSSKGQLMEEGGPGMALSMDMDQGRLAELQALG